MTQPTLHYIYDALCGWCYAASPLVKAARAAGTNIVIHGGDLWSTAAVLDPGKRLYIASNDERIAALSGVEFGDDYRDGLLKDPTATLWSRPTVEAILAAGMLKPQADLDMLEAIQNAHYRQGRKVIERSVLIDLATDLGLDGDAFELALSESMAARHVRETRAWMDEFRLSGFPSFLLEVDGALCRLPHERFYGRPDDFVAAIDAAASHRPPAVTSAPSETRH